MTDTPNLYGFATKELAQDATIAYILAWAKPEYRESHPSMHALGTKFLCRLLATQEVDLPPVETLCIQTQVDRIDILVTINMPNGGNGIVLVIEDKVSTQEHSDQIERYKCLAKKRYKCNDDQIVAVYLKTGNESNGKLPSKDKCGRFLRRDLLDVLNLFAQTNNAIVDDFRTHLQRWEDETNAWESLLNFHQSPGKTLVCRGTSWDDIPRELKRALEGFYTALESSWRGRSVDSCSWRYVANPAGGFLAWWGGRQQVGTAERHVHVQMQISNAMRLTIRLGNGNALDKVRSRNMYRVLEALIEVNRGTSDGILIEKAGRFRGGLTADVAEVTLVNGKPWLAVDAEVIVDLDASLERLYLGGRNASQSGLPSRRDLGLLNFRLRYIYDLVVSVNCGHGMRVRDTAIQTRAPTRGAPTVSGSNSLGDGHLLPIHRTLARIWQCRAGITRFLYW